MQSPLHLIVRRFFLHEERTIIAGNRSIRRRLRKRPFLYALFGGTGVVLFWRGIWHIADITPYLENPFASLVVGIGILFISGLLVFQLIGQAALDERLDDLLQVEQELKREEEKLATEEAALAKQEQLLRVAVDNEEQRRSEPR